MRRVWSWRIGFRRLRAKLTLSYALTTIMALLLLELISIVLIFVVVNVALPQFVLLGLRPQAQQAATYFAHGAPDRTALTAWLNLPDAFAKGSYQSGFLTIVDQRGVVIASVGDQAVPSGAPLPARLSEVAATNLRHVLAGQLGPNGAVDREPNGALVVEVPIVGSGGATWGALIERVGDVGQANAFWIAFYARDVVLPSTLIFVLFGGVAGAIFGAFTARGFTRRFARVSTVVDRWSQGDFSLIAHDRSDDELGQLARRLNRMAEQLQHLLRTRQKLATLEERNRLARELHDSVKQQVFAVSLQVSAAKGLMRRDAGEALTHLDEAERLVRQAQRELTALIRELRPAELERQGLEAALREHVTQWSRQTGIAADVQSEGGRESPPNVAETLFRIAQEALTNVARHSQATAVQVLMTCERDGAILTIADNGRGFDPAATDGQGMGLLSMRERAQALGGEVRVESVAGQGTTVIARCASTERGA